MPEELITKEQVIKKINELKSIDYSHELQDVEHDFIQNSGMVIGAQYLAYKLLVEILQLFPLKVEEDRVAKEKDRFSNIGKPLET